jgi:GR25 family glycosyltransferase involved in LPS biosynthesis
LAFALGNLVCPAEQTDHWTVIFEDDNLF